MSPSGSLTYELPGSASKGSICCDTQLALNHLRLERNELPLNERAQACECDVLPCPRRRVGHPPVLASVEHVSDAGLQPRSVLAGMVRKRVKIRRMQSGALAAP